MFLTQYWPSHVLGSTGLFSFYVKPLLGSLNCYERYLCVSAKVIVRKLRMLLWMKKGCVKAQQEIIALIRKSGISLWL